MRTAPSHGAVAQEPGRLRKCASIPAATSWMAPSISGRTAPRPRGTLPPRPNVRTGRHYRYRLRNPNGLHPATANSRRIYALRTQRKG